MELARQFGVSRITVRDAIRTLEARGMVQVRAGARGGARVAYGDPDRFADALAIQLKLVGIDEADVYEAQDTIECVTAELAAHRATSEDRATLRALLDQAAQHVDEAVPFTELALDFHLAVVRAAHNRALLAAVEALREAMRDYYTPQTTREVAGKVMRTHTAILDAIEHQDGAEARRLMEQHIHDVQQAAGATRDPSLQPSSKHPKETPV
jgi:DNA-binding FadR family transcriptional regulator